MGGRNLLHERDGCKDLPVMVAVPPPFRGAPDVSRFKFSRRQNSLAAM